MGVSCLLPLLLLPLRELLPVATTARPAYSVAALNNWKACCNINCR